MDGEISHMYAVIGFAYIPALVLALKLEWTGQQPGVIDLGVVVLGLAGVAVVGVVFAIGYLIGYVSKRQL